MESKQYEALLEQYGELLEQENNLKDDVLICECFLISAGDIRKSLSQNNTQIDNLPKWCFETSDLGHGCGSCIKNQDEWKHRIVNERET